MINQKISRDPKVAELIGSPEVGSWGGIFYTWLIAHLDREGRAPGDPRILKGMVCPMLDEVTQDVVSNTLARAHELGLIEVYEVEGARYLHYPKFPNNQKGMRINREPESDYPDPPQDGSTLAPSRIQSVDSLEPEGNGREWKGMEEKEREGNQTGLARYHQDVKTIALGGDRSSVIKAIRAVFEFWSNQGHPSDFPQVHHNLKEFRALEQRIQSDGFTIKQLQDAIRGIHLDDWEGRDASNTTLWHVVKDAEAVQRFIAKAQKKKTRSGPRSPAHARIEK